ncbi:FxsA family protein [Magnetovibrio sp. PR-2]|uniref:FxsA family protein n=1 Tax=Magnetovibrio sp. PR-2 TaxID=3120356 RepID=UPI002FCE65EF
MGLIILAAFIAVPLIEIGLFIQVGETIGLWSTIAVVILTAVVGTALLRHQGLSTIVKVQRFLDQGVMPVDALFDGFCILIAGLLLLTPGFFTDALGFMFFTPPLRKLLRVFLARHVQVQTSGHANMHSGMHSAMHGDTAGGMHGFDPYDYQGAPEGGQPQGGAGDVIDGEYQDVTEHKNAPKIDQSDDTRT